MITMVSAIPERPYDPDKVALGTKIARHLRKKGWKKVARSGVWVDPKDKSEHTFIGAIRVLLNREGTTL